MPKNQTLRTVKEAKALLRLYGVTQVQFARELSAQTGRDIDVQSVREVLSEARAAKKTGRGPRVGHFGATHLIMVALGMKPLPPGQVPFDFTRVAASLQNPINERAEKKRRQGRLTEMCNTSQAA